MNLRDHTDTNQRRKALEKEIYVDLPQIAAYSSDLEVAAIKNCENMIGAAQIPLGVAGPLRIQESVIANEVKQSHKIEEILRDRHVADAPRDDNYRDYYLPLATTEGALVASISRGCKAITETGGAIVSTYKAGMTRGPVFYTGSIKNKSTLYEFVENHESRIKNVVEKTSRHLKLLDITIKALPNYTFLRFSYDTGDAMGMNMATIATQAAVEYIEKETGIPCISVAGNFDIDKKPAWLNSIEGRGIKAWAEVVLPKNVVADILKTTPQKFFDVWLAKVMLGSAVSGSIGFNAHIANVIAAIFIATGQDPAHVVEGSLGITTAKVLENGDLYVGVFLPALLLGTVGGGTNLPTQKEALSILGLTNDRHSGKNVIPAKAGIQENSAEDLDPHFHEDDKAIGSGKVEEFAHIVVAACLAGEVSLLASLSEGSLAKAHKSLGRNSKSQILNSK